ncbi:hypothetical protein ABZT03_08360 [Streptomyces sp. NPDC005574]|uniref:hypothetical protein n=1 Tax=Streptomyces sp. NPDC005574 TaxID=3156891 RepID=UPI0033A9AC52
MTQRRTDEAPPAGPADSYLESLRERLAADGCLVTAGTWNDCRVVIGSRSDRRARWFGTKVELFVLAAAVPAVDEVTLAAFTAWAMNYAKSIRSGVSGARNAAMVLPALISTDVRPSARTWAAKDARLLGVTVIGRPITVETSASKVTRVTMYQGKPLYGGLFTRHVLDKASLYFR